MVAMWKKWFPQGWRAQVRHHKKDKGLGAICGVRIGMGEWRKVKKSRVQNGVHLPEQGDGWVGWNRV